MSQVFDGYPCKKFDKIYLHILLFQNIQNILVRFEKKNLHFLAAGGSIPPPQRTRPLRMKVFFTCSLSQLTYTVLLANHSTFLLAFLQNKFIQCTLYICIYMIFSPLLPFIPSNLCNDFDVRCGQHKIIILLLSLDSK